MAPWALARRPPTARWRLRLLSRWVDRPSSYTRWQATSRPPHGLRACSVLGHTDNDEQDGVCDTGPRQTAVDDMHVATRRHRVVDTPGGGRASYD